MFIPEYIRALAFVIITAIPAFMIGRKVANGIVTDDEFLLWRNIWLMTAVVVFVSGNFLLFAAFLGLLSIYVHRLKFNPVYIYIILLFSAPALNVTVGIPDVMNKILDFNPARLLAVFFLLPAAIGLLSRPRSASPQVADNLVISLLVLLCGLSFRKPDFTESLRACATYIIDIALPYFVFSRALTTFPEFRKAFLALVIAALPLSGAALIETFKAWRIYNNVIDAWGIHLITSYLFRDGQLRASVTAVEPIALGVIFLAASGCLLTVLRSRMNRKSSLAALALLAAGLFASVSRGPWLGFAILVIIVLSLSKHIIRNVSLALVGLIMVVGVLGATSTGDRVYKLLPFVGTVEKNNEDYRVKLIMNSMAVIAKYPLLGSEDYILEPEMQELVQGQGIVDVVNAYVAVALSTGIVGLIIFTSIFALISMNLLHVNIARKYGIDNIALFSTIVSTLVTIGTTGSVSVIPYIIWIIAGVSVGLIRACAVEPRQNSNGHTPVAIKILGGKFDQHTTR